MAGNVRCYASLISVLDSEYPNNAVGPGWIEVEANKDERDTPVQYCFTFMKFDFAKIRNDLRGKDITKIDLRVYISTSREYISSQDNPYQFLYFRNYLIVKNWDSTITYAKYQKDPGMLYKDAALRHFTPPDLEAPERWNTMPVGVPAGNMGCYNFLDCLMKYGIALCAHDNYAAPTRIAYEASLSSTSAYVPYLEITCEDITPGAGNMTPASG